MDMSSARKGAGLGAKIIAMPCMLAKKTPSTLNVLLTSQAQNTPRQATSAQADAEECDGALEAKLGGGFGGESGLGGKIERSTRPGYKASQVEIPNISCFVAWCHLWYRAQADLTFLYASIVDCS